MATRARPAAQIGALYLVPWGPVALERLEALLAGAQVADALAPVTVVVPSSHAGATVRRRLAAAPGRSGLVNVGFVSFPQLAETLAAPFLAAERRPPLGPTVRLAAIRAALRAHPAWFRGAAGSPSALQTLAQTLGELRDLDGHALDDLAASDARAHDVVALFRDVQARCAAYADDHEVLAAAVTCVEQGGRTVDEVGHVVAYLPRRLRPLDLDLGAALAAAGRLSVVLGTDPSRRDADAPSAAAILARLGDAMPIVDGQVDEVGTPEASAGATVRLVRAPDPHEEVRHAVRTVLDAAAAGAPVDRMAIVARLSDPYFALVHEELSAAGIPHHGPTGLSLAQSVAGRTLLGAVELVEHDLPRVDLFQWLRSGPLRGPDGQSLPVDRLDRLARETGIPGGYEVWCDRLDAERDRLEERRRARDEREAAAAAATDQPADEGPPRFDRLAQDIDDVGTLRALVEWLGEAAPLLAGGGWAERSAWAADFLAVALGPPERLVPRPRATDVDEPELAEVATAPDDGADARPVGDGDEAAYLRVVQILESLAALDAVDPDGDGPAFRAVLGLALDAPGPPAGRFGHGVFVGTLAEAVGADHDLLVVVGMAEGIYPPRGQDDPVLPDAVRADLGVEALPARRPARADECRDHVAALAGSTSVVLSFARADTRAQRERFPSRWYLDELRRRLGRPPDQPVGIDDLDDLADEAGKWWTDVVSFVAAVDRTAATAGASRASGGSGGPGGEAPALVTVAERTAAAILAHRDIGDEHGRVEVPADRPALVRGALAVVERQVGHFGVYTGRVGRHEQLRFVDDRVGSATALETWATCPFRYFLRQVLRVRPLDERAEADDINALDRGSYVHAVLEQTVDGGLDAELPPDAPLGPDDLERLRRIAAEEGERFRLQGRTGRPLLWKLRSRQLLRLLEQIMTVDRSHRLGRAVQPIAVELAFGSRDDEGAWTGVPPVVIDLSGDRSVAFRGYVDRVDRSPDGDRLVVIDYKTGKSDHYRDVKPKKGPGDIVGRGQHLQLALYAMAAESAYGSTSTVSAFFWFVEQVADPFIGGLIDEWARARLVEVLEIIVGGIEQGWFPARPGDEGFWGFENCGFCDFNRICPSARAEQWERVRLAPELDDFRELAEGPLVTPAGSES